jgi:hypothetical protein
LEENVSRAAGKIRLSDGYIVYAVFDGTHEDGTMLRKMYLNRDDIFDDENGFKVDYDDMPEFISGHHDCNCGHDEEVELATEWGKGMHWKGRACRYCMVITQHLHPCFIIEPPECSMCPPVYDEDEDTWFYKNGLPEWWDDDTKNTGNK